jgi:hypothetical protein
MAQASKIVPLNKNQDETGSYDPFDPKVLGVRVETTATRQPRKKRPPFIPAMSQPEFTAVIASGVSARAVGLWGMIRMQTAVERKEWIRVRTQFKRDLGMVTDMAFSRAVAALKKAGFIEVKHQPGRASLVRLMPQRAGEGDGDG